MDGRWGLGPVFAAEWQTGSRSRRMYAIRAGFVLTLLVVLLAVWYSETNGRGSATVSDFAAMGSSFYFGLVGAQLSLILLAAPAATAGAICQERSRGTLTHLLVTDLSDAEIVLGKLAARLVPTLGLVLCALPVQYLASLLGGIDPQALMGSTVVALVVAAFACSLALTLSAWGRKTQEVLLATYAVLLVWLLSYGAASMFGLEDRWPWKLDPFQLAFLPYSDTPEGAWTDYLAFAAVWLAASAALIAVATRRFRAVAARGDRPAGKKARREWRALRRFRPTLDADPVFWREWHRARPSRWTRMIWWGYYAAVALFGVVAIHLTVASGSLDETTLYIVAFGSAIGLLLLSVDAATALAEERARGSLDILMTTPLTTRAIVWGKWRGSFRGVLGLTLLPTIVTAACLSGWSRWLAAAKVLGLMLAYGAAITSLGLALATWVPRLGRAVALGVGTYVLVTAGLFFLVFTDIIPDHFQMEVAGGSPFFGAIFPMVEDVMTERKVQPDQHPSPLAVPVWITFYASTAAALLLGTLATFDRSLGRARGDRRPDGSRVARRLQRSGRRPFAGPPPEVARHALEK